MPPVPNSHDRSSSGSPLDIPIRILFSEDEPNLMFVEVEDANGVGLGVGTWVTEVCNDHTYHVLYMTPRDILQALGLSAVRGEKEA